MRVLCLCLLLCASPVSAIERVELTVGRLTTQAGLDLREVSVDWRRADGALRAGATVRHPQLPEAVQVEASCASLRTEDGLHCVDTQLRARGAALGHIDARVGLALRHAGDWQLQLHQAEALLSYNSDDGRVAAENLELRAEGRAARKRDDWSGQLRLQAPTGQAYAEPVFADFSAQPLRAHIELQASADALQLQQLELLQDGVGRLQMQGQARVADWSTQHRLDLHIEVVDGEAATAAYLQPLLAATPLQDTAFGGSLQARARLPSCQRSVDSGAAAVSVQAASPSIPFSVRLNPGTARDAAASTMPAVSTRRSTSLARACRLPPNAVSCSGVAASSGCR
jgi:hypothetical protein